MKYLLLLIAISFAFISKAQKVSEQKVYSTNIPTQNLNALLGTTRLFAMENVCKDSVFILFLEKNNSYEKKDKHY